MRCGIPVNGLIPHRRDTSFFARVYRAKATLAKAILYKGNPLQGQPFTKVSLSELKRIPPQ